MSDNRTQEIDLLISLVSDYWKQHPQLRLGQLLKNIAADLEIDLFYLTDQRLLEYLQSQN